MNNAYLRLNSKEEDEDVVEGGFASQTEKIAEEKSREPQVTFFSLFGNDGGRAFGWNKNKTRGVLTLFLGSLLFSSALFLLASLTKSVVALIAGASLMAVSVPLSSVVFFYGFNNMKNVGIFEISIGAFIGAAYFVVVELCSVRIDAVTSTGYMSENLKITLLTIGEDIIRDSDSLREVVQKGLRIRYDSYRRKYFRRIFRRRYDNETCKRTFHRYFGLRRNDVRDSCRFFDDRQDAEGVLPRAYQRGYRNNRIDVSVVDCLRRAGKRVAFAGQG